MFGSVIAGLVLGLVIAFKRITNPAVIVAYAVVAGRPARRGQPAGSRARYPGIVIQAVLGTFGDLLRHGGALQVAGPAGHAEVHEVRASARSSASWSLSLINFVLYLFGFDIGLVDNGTDGRSAGWRSCSACVGIVVGALTFILDFAEVEEGVRQGLPEKYAWYCAFGLLVGLIFLYWRSCACSATCAADERRRAGTATARRLVGRVGTLDAVPLGGVQRVRGRAAAPTASTPWCRGWPTWRADAEGRARAGGAAASTTTRRCPTSCGWSSARPARRPAAPAQLDAGRRPRRARPRVGQL